MSERVNRLVRKPDAGKRPVRFDERDVETGHGRDDGTPANERAGQQGKTNIDLNHRATPRLYIIPNYNHSKYIVDQLDALVSQTLPPLEVIVIDDGSTDDSVEVVERFEGIPSSGCCGMSGTSGSWRPSIED